MDHSLHCSLHCSSQSELLNSVIERLASNPSVADVIGIQASDISSLAKLFGLILGRVAQDNDEITNITDKFYSQHPEILEHSIRDISETARRNFEPGGVAATLLFSRGIHAILAHRVAHQLWLDDDKSLALAIKSTLGRALSTDIHPAAQIGSGIWLDHGLGFVVGETAVIENDVSIWHNVTLGSTLTDAGTTRHPRIKRGAVIGAGATILGDITIGEGAIVASGAIVLNDVPASRVAAGTKATIKGNSSVSFVTNNEKN